jgi:hypothetical protein
MDVCLPCNKQWYIHHSWIKGNRVKRYHREGIQTMRDLLEKGYSYVRRFVLQRDTLFSSPQTPQQHSSFPEQRDTPSHYREAPSAPASPQQGSMYPPQQYPQQGYPQQGFPQQGYWQRGGVNPWVAGGLGALGGGLAGYGVSQAVGEMQQDANGDDHPPDGQSDFADSGFADAGFGGMDSGGGDFGGE